MNNSNKDNKRAALLYYGDSNTKKFPLILFLGREFNSGTEVDPSKTDYYCFKESPRSTFWNYSYSLISKVTDENHFKLICRKKNLSPIVFSNVSPKPIPSNAAKAKIRSEITPEEFKSHFDQLFNQELIFRVELIVISVGEGLFTQGIEIIKKNDNIRNIPILTIPYLGQGSSPEKIKKTI